MAQFLTQTVDFYILFTFRGYCLTAQTNKCTFLLQNFNLDKVFLVSSTPGKPAGVEQSGHSSSPFCKNRQSFVVATQTKLFLTIVHCQFFFGKFPDGALIHFVESPGSVLSLVLIPFSLISIPFGYFYL